MHRTARCTVQGLAGLVGKPGEPGRPGIQVRTFDYKDFVTPDIIYVNFSVGKNIFLFAL